VSAGHGSISAPSSDHRHRGQRIEWIRRELGVTYMVFNSEFGGLTASQTSRSMSLFGERVPPHFSNIGAVSGTPPQTVDRIRLRRTPRRSR
jgi:hypothetical protein